MSGSSSIVNLTRILMLILALGAGFAARAGVTVTDDEGRLLQLAAPAQRIVSLSPHATELLFAAELGNKVIGAAEYSDYPSSAKSLPRIGSAAALDLERIVSLKPDLAIAWGSGNPKGQLQNLMRLGVPVFVSEPRQPADIASNIRRLGQLGGNSAAGERTALDFEQRLDNLRARYSHRPQVDVFYQIWDQPLMTVGGTHMISRIISLCGGHNVFAGQPQLAVGINREAVLRADPEVIVASGMDAQRPVWLDDWRAWPQLRAVRTSNLFFIAPELIQRQTPRIIDGAERLCALLESARSRQAGK